MDRWACRRSRLRGRGVAGHGRPGGRPRLLAAGEAGRDAGQRDRRADRRRRPTAVGRRLRRRHSRVGGGDRDGGGLPWRAVAGR